MCWRLFTGRKHCHGNTSVPPLITHILAHVSVSALSLQTTTNQPQTVPSVKCSSGTAMLVNPHCPPHPPTRALAVYSQAAAAVFCPRHIRLCGRIQMALNKQHYPVATMWHSSVTVLACLIFSAGHGVIYHAEGQLGSECNNRKCRAMRKLYRNTEVQGFQGSRIAKLRGIIRASLP